MEPDDWYTTKGWGLIPMLLPMTPLTYRGLDTSDVSAVEIDSVTIEEETGYPLSDYDVYEIDLARLYSDRSNRKYFEVARLESPPTASRSRMEVLDGDMLHIMDGDNVLTSIDVKTNGRSTSEERYTILFSFYLTYHFTDEALGELRGGAPPAAGRFDALDPGGTAEPAAPLRRLFRGGSLHRHHRAEDGTYQSKRPIE